MAAVDVVIGRLLDELIPLLKDELNLQRNSKKEAEILTKNLEKIKLILDDAESKQLRRPLIKSWLEQLQVLAYDVEDALDNWNVTKNNHLRLLQEDESFFTKVCLSVHSFSSCCKGVVEHRSIALEIKDLNQKIKESYDNGIKELNLMIHTPTSTIDTSSSGASQRKVEGDRITTSGFIESHVYAREEDTSKLKSMLLSCHDGKQNTTIPVVSIVGTGGLGKTTLAKMVYKELANDFPQRIWVCVSDLFDQISVAKQILEQLGDPCPNIFGLEALTQLIQTSLESSKFLLVLDDVWIEDSNIWQQLNACLSVGVNGSVILVTTRKHNTAMAMGCDSRFIHTLQPVNTNVCWSIIGQLANMSSRNDLQLERIGKEIAKKCAGSPLAAKVLGGLLQKKTSVQDWQRVLHSQIWELENVDNELFRHFFLSYDELKPATKRCFSFCAIFPKDFKINVGRLIKMWTSHGFLSSSTGNTELQGRSVFDDLSQRSFFQDFQKEKTIMSDGRVVGCKMHDIVHDFAQYLTKNECVVVTTRSNWSFLETARHLSWVEKDKPETFDSGSMLYNATKLRTFLCRWNLPSNFLKQLKCVRELCLSKCSLLEVPTEIGNMIHLRYLDLSLNKISVIPQNMCNLNNLQTLYLWGNGAICGLPEDIGRLVKLRHVSMSELVLSGLARLPNLSKANGKISIRKEGENKLGCLAQLNQLEGTLDIILEGLDDDADVDEAEKAAMICKEFIHTLFLTYDENVKLGVVEAMQPNSDLLHLFIKGWVLPKWVTIMENLRKLCLIDVSSQELPSLWKLPFLKALTVQNWGGEYVGHEFLGLSCSDSESQVNVKQEFDHIDAFPSLKTLIFQDCRKWKEWQDINDKEEKNVTIMPRLTYLKITGCPDLKVLPHRLLRQLASSSLTTVKGISCAATNKGKRVGRYK